MHALPPRAAAPPPHSHPSPLTPHPSLLTRTPPPARYALQLKPWLDTYGAEQLLVVQKGDLAERPRITLENVSAFLGSPHKYSQDKEVKGGATQKPKHRDYSGDAQLPEKLKVELEEFFRPHRAAFAQVLKARKVKKRGSPTKAKRRIWREASSRACCNIFLTGP